MIHACTLSVVGYLCRNLAQCSNHKLNFKWENSYSLKKKCHKRYNFCGEFSKSQNYPEKYTLHLYTVEDFRCYVIEHNQTSKVRSSSKPCYFFYFCMKKMIQPFAFCVHFYKVCKNFLWKTFYPSIMFIASSAV